MDPYPITSMPSYPNHNPLHRYQNPSNRRFHDLDSSSYASILLFAHVHMVSIRDVPTRINFPFHPL